ncbi:type I restriction-modification system subunit M N-terminal domain-containing protein [Providencia stuartii]|uniref:type I restriction-modification system subunit M N-terminal domain-containing protein n=1 Tax=Providencia stuartii TaxID=588 RepID=UPI001E32F4C3|nr:type I restriction-modification system subunit M N-terminal domain-containing protein [Providencia stuartii]WAZ75631.1 type I restriction-modification system subunit M N-terminal domain-containing protein [Providencia stuartii]
MTTANDAQQLRELQGKLWDIADSLRGKMHADEFRDYCLGFIFYKYLSEQFANYADHILKQDGLTYSSLDIHSPDYADILEAVKSDAIEAIGQGFILEDLSKILRGIEQSTLGSESVDDFSNLFEDLDLTSSKLGNTEAAKNELIASIINKLDELSFNLTDANTDILGDAYEYLIGEFASGAGKKAGEFYTMSYSPCSNKVHLQESREIVTFS